MSPLTLATSVSIIVYTSIAVSTIFETVQPLLRQKDPFPLYSAGMRPLAREPVKIVNDVVVVIMLRVSSETSSH
eukprot:SAG22_NODE_4244_length_1329_cov_80.413821_1_plen_73_part_10